MLTFSTKLLPGRAQQIPLPDGPGQVKLPIREVDFRECFTWNHIESVLEMQYFGILASENFCICQTLPALTMYASYIKPKSHPSKIYLKT